LTLARAPAEDHRYATCRCEDHGYGRICFQAGNSSVAGELVPVLWLTGPAGVGKTTASWQIFTEVAQAGMSAAFVDTDQLCMCYPAPSQDPDRQRIKAQNLAAMLPRYQLAGAQCVIANGVLDPVKGLYLDLLAEAEVTVCRMRADRAELTRRLAGRHGPGHDLVDVLKEALDEADAMDASDFADGCVDTTNLTMAEVVGLVRERCRTWPGFTGTLPEPRAGTGRSTRAGDDDEPDGAGGNVLLICGPAGVGKSTIGFELYLRYLRAGRTAGYIDLDQIGFLEPGAANDPGRHVLKAGNLAAMWRTYHAAGARHLIATGPIPSAAAGQTYIDALPAETVTVCRLHAELPELRTRIMSRALGGSWPQPGDPLRGQSAQYLGRAADRAAASARALDRAQVGDIRIDTDGRTVTECADLIAEATNFRP
jgi:predicted ABC-type ATPase